MFVDRLKDYIIQKQIMSAKDRNNISISLMISDAPRRPDLLSRRYIISKDQESILSVQFLPKPWRFSPEDIMKTRSFYEGLHSFKVPKLLGYFSSDEGYFFIEEYIPSGISMDMLIERGDINHQQAKEIIRDILLEIWENSDPADGGLITEEKNNYYKYLQLLIGECYLFDIMVVNLDKLIDDNAMMLKKMWSTGDIRDRNLLLSNGHWYLVDFEYCHQTMFLFKEAYRNIHYSMWARNLRIDEIFPCLGKIPVEAAELLSLAWENYLYSEMVDRQCKERFQHKAWKLSWNILCPQVNNNMMQLETSVDKLQRELDTIKASTEWRFLKKIEQMKNQIIPVNSIRSKIFARFKGKKPS